MGVTRPQYSVNEQGFILAATLWILAIMFVAVGIFHTYVQHKIQLGIQAKENVQDRLDRQSTQQTLLYLLGSSRMTRSGLTFTQQVEADFLTEEGFLTTDPIGDEMLLDGTVYSGLGTGQFAVQELSGLIAINVPNPFDLAILIEKFDPNPVNRAQMFSRLQDYMDANERVSLSGAEKEDYLRAGLVPLTNDFLRSETELYRILGWQQWLDAHPQFHWQEWLSVRRDSVMNLNTMPRSLLMNYLALNEETANLLMQERVTNPFRTVADFVARTGLPINLEEDKYRFFPSNEFRLSLWSRGGQAEVISLQLTPNGLYGPWQINYQYSVQRVNENNQSATPAMVLEQTGLFGHTLGDNR